MQRVTWSDLLNANDDDKEHFWVLHWRERCRIAGRSAIEPYLRQMPWSVITSSRLCQLPLEERFQVTPHEQEGSRHDLRPAAGTGRCQRGSRAGRRGRPRYPCPA